MWTAGRESILVDDRLDRTPKDAMNAVLSQVNDCPYREDMLVSLVYAGRRHEAADTIFAQSGHGVADPVLQERLAWVRSVTTPGDHAHPPMPFSREELPEAIAALMAMSDINRFSHVVIADSPVSAPLGIQRLKALALRWFGSELKPTQAAPVPAGRTLSLLPAPSLPDDLWWAAPHPRIAGAVARWAGTVEDEATAVVPDAVREHVGRNLDDWDGRLMPLSRSWVDREVAGLSGIDRDIARLALVLAKAPYQVDDSLVQPVIGHDPDEARFIRILAWASATGARRFARGVAETAGHSLNERTSAAQASTQRSA